MSNPFPFEMKPAGNVSLSRTARDLFSSDSISPPLTSEVVFSGRDKPQLIVAHSQEVLSKMKKSTSRTDEAMEPLLYSRKHAAFLLSVSLSSIDNLMNTAQLEYRNIGCRRLIPAWDLRRFIHKASIGNIKVVPGDD